jgi:hypothetical protein
MLLDNFDASPTYSWGSTVLYFELKEIGKGYKALEGLKSKYN